MSIRQTTSQDNHPTNQQVALSLASQGVRVFPCHADDGPPGNDGHPLWRVKSPMPRIRWKDGATTDAAIINTWWESAPAALVGMPLGPLDLVVLDPDQHPDGPDGLAAYAELAHAYPGLLEGPFVETPQGRHYFFQQPEPRLGNAQGSLPPGINVRGDGGYVIAPGSTLPDGRSWVLHGKLNAARQLPRPIIDMLQGHVPPPAGGAEADNDEVFGAAEAARRASYAQTAFKNARDKILAAVKGNRNNMLNIHSFKLGRLVGGKVVNEAEAYEVLEDAGLDCGLDDNEVARTIRSGLEKGKLQPRGMPAADDIVAEFWDEDESETSTEHPQQPADRIWKGSELGDIPRSKFLIDGLIPQNTLGLMVGESQTFKSFMAQSMSLAIAAELPAWEGHSIDAPPGAIALYIAGEGGIESVAKRQEAWAQEKGIAISKLDRFRVITWGINLMDKLSLQRLVKACQAQIDGPLALVVIDTINTASAGADENSTQDMGNLYAVMRRLSGVFKATIMGVHHTNKSGTIRGSNLLPQNADFQLFLSRPLSKWLTMNIELQVAKLKDAATGLREDYHLDLVALADGSTSLTPKRIGAIQAEQTETTAAGRPSSRTDAILDVLRRSRNIEGETRSEICNILNITVGSEKNAVSQALRRLLAQNMVTRDGSRWQIIEAESGDEMPLATFVTSNFFD